MRHHAYFYAGDIEEGNAHALSYAKDILGLTPNTPDCLSLQYALFSVDDARYIRELASRTPLQGDRRLIVISAGRLFHEAQNALLKTFEEPPESTTLILVVPSEGNIIPTLRSRLLPLPEIEGTTNRDYAPAEAFLRATPSAREKIVAKLLDRAKSDDAEEKQNARLEIVQFAEGLTHMLYAKKRTKETTALLSDLSRLIPVLHERSAPLKPILEHLSIALEGQK